MANKVNINDSMRTILAINTTVGVTISIVDKAPIRHEQDNFRNTKANKITPSATVNSQVSLATSIVFPNIDKNIPIKIVNPSGSQNIPSGAFIYNGLSDMCSDHQRAGKKNRASSLWGNGNVC